MTTATTSHSHDRLVSLDQFRGYTVAAMIFVDWFGFFENVPSNLQHHNTFCSYADIIMPQFLFAVGFAFRLTFPRRLEHDGMAAAYRKVFVRSVGLFILATAFYGLNGNFKSWDDVVELGALGYVTQLLSGRPWATLAHIAATALWILPVIHRGPRARFAFLVFTTALYWAMSQVWYYQYVGEARVSEGGPFGFMSWAIPALIGSFACDAVKGREARDALRLILGWGVALCVFGYGLSCVTAIKYGVADPTLTGWRAYLASPPFSWPVHPQDFWTMAQNAGTLSYQFFCAGASMLSYGFFLWFSDIRGRQIGLFRTFGENPLVPYLMHRAIVRRVIRPIPSDAPFWFLLIGCALFMWYNWFFTRYLEKRKIFVRL